MARSQILTIREEEYVQSLNAFGLNDFIICYKHMLPNAIGPIVVNIILNAAQDMYTLQNNWWLWLPVGIVISSFVMGINFLGDGLRDTTDPTQQG